MVKTKTKLLLWNRCTDFNVTWYVASGTLAHHSLYVNHYLGLTLTYGKVNFGYIGFSMEESENIEFFKSYVASDPES